MKTNLKKFQSQTFNSVTRYKHILNSIRLKQSERYFPSTKRLTILDRYLLSSVTTHFTTVIIEATRIFNLDQLCLHMSVIHFIRIIGCEQQSNTTRCYTHTQKLRNI